MYLLLVSELAVEVDGGYRREDVVGRVEQEVHSGRLQIVRARQTCAHVREHYSHAVCIRSVVQATHTCVQYTRVLCSTVM